MSQGSYVIIGGGISGLSCAYYLHKYARNAIWPRKIIVIEASKHLGGYLKTSRFYDGVLHELGPRSIRCTNESGYNALTLVDEIGLGKEVIGVPYNKKAAKNKFICINNQLVKLPGRFTDLFTSKPPINKPLVSYAIKEIRMPKLDLKDDDDLSVYDFVTQRFDENIANYFFGSLCRGISSGDFKKLSFNSMFPEIYAGYLKKGSIIKGFFTPPSSQKHYGSDLALWAKSNRWGFWNLKQGLQAFPEQLCDFLLNLKENPIEIYNESQVTKIETNNENLVLHIQTKDETLAIEAKHIFSAIPARNLAKILPFSHEVNKLRQLLSEIHSNNVITVNLEYRGKKFNDETTGFGFLVPPMEKSNAILGITYDSVLFPSMNGNQDNTRLTAMLGGHVFEEYFGEADSVDENEILSITCKTVEQVLSFKEDPIRYIVTVHKNAIPQYNVGHKQKLLQIADELQRSKFSLSLIGASYNGISVPDCILSSKLEAQRFAKALGQKTREEIK